MTAGPAVNLCLCRGDGRYPAGAELRCDWRIRRVDPARVATVETTVLWTTDGKGDAEFHVHHFVRHTRDQLAARDVTADQVLRCKLPPSPLSYDGRLISLRWLVRLRVFIDGRGDVVADLPFHLVSPAAPGRDVAEPAGDGRCVTVPV